MDWLATIDLPMMTLSQSADKQMDGAVLSEVLNAIRDQKIKMLFREELFNLLDWGCEPLARALSLLPEVGFVEYESNAKSTYINANPDVLNALVNSAEADECKHQLYYFHTETTQVGTIYIICRNISGSQTLSTILDKKSRQHSLLLVQKGGVDIDGFMSSHRPILNQQKHHSTPYLLDGKRVAPFSAYNPNDTSYAESLLAQAFDDFQGTLSPDSQPDSLYTRDFENETYVCFNHSGNWEYHGYDIPVMDTRLPKYIKEKYHVWK